MWEHFGATEKQPKNPFEITDQCGFVCGLVMKQWTVNPPLSGICFPDDFLTSNLDCSTAAVRFRGNMKDKIN